MTLHTTAIRAKWKPALAVVLVVMSTHIGETGPGSDTLWPNEALNPGEFIQAGSTILAYQGDNNLVLYQNGSPLWATYLSGNAPPVTFVMQESDCNAVIYHQVQNINTGEWSTVAGWNTRTGNQGGGCYARVIEGDWFICNGQTRIWSARGGGSCDVVTDYVNQQQTTENVHSIQYPFDYCSTLQQPLPAHCSFYCAYLGSPLTEAAFDVKFLRGTRTIRTGEPVNQPGLRVVIGDEVQMSGDYCWIVFPNNPCVDQNWRNPESPRC